MLLPGGAGYGVDRLLGRMRPAAVLWLCCLQDSLGATVYDRASRTTHWRLAWDEDVVMQLENAGWNVLITWSGLVSARAPQP